ncbi:MAG TPA: RNA polymerase sigma factor [Polyangiaceae bacterium]
MAAHESVGHLVGSPGRAEVSPAPARGAVPPFESIYQQYFDFVWSSARRLGVSGAAVDDVVQEIFIVIHAKIHTLEKPQSLRSWIYGIVRRTVSDHHRSQRARNASAAGLAVHTELEQGFPPTPFDLTEQNDQVKLLWLLLAELDAAKREVFILAELEEMPVPEIAEALDLPLNTAYSRLRAARQAFEAALARRAAQERERGPACRG